MKFQYIKVKPLNLLVIDSLINQLNSDNQEVTAKALKKLDEIINLALLHNSFPLPTPDVIDLLISSVGLLNHQNGDFRRVGKELCLEVRSLLAVSNFTSMPIDKINKLSTTLNNLKNTHPNEDIRDISQMALDKLCFISLDEAIDENLITADVAIRFEKYLPVLLSEKGVDILRKQLLPISFLLRFSENHFAPLASASGMQALLDRRITADQLLTMTPEQIAISVNEPLQEMLRENLLTQSLAEFFFEFAGALSSKKGVEVLREGILPLDYLRNVSHRHLRPLLSDAGLQALLDHRITREQLWHMNPQHIEDAVRKADLQNRDKKNSL